MIEVALAAVLLPWLARRGWRFRDEVGAPEWRDVLRGTALWTVVFAIGIGVASVAAAVLPVWFATADGTAVGGRLSWWLVGAALVINPLFEEVLWLGYAVPTLERVVGTPAAALVSLGLRGVVHWNQGAQALVGVVPVGVVYTAYFLRTRRLWPVVVAHVIVNAIGFSAMLK